jgi:4-amino-4-deoxy-L-arabinose transferase-like glycosyltransferase
MNDEGEMGLAGRCILNGACTDFFDTAWAAQPRLAFVPTALSLAAFGNTATAARIPSVIFGVAAVAFTWLFARDVFGRTVGLISAAILASLPMHVHFSRLAVDNVVDATYSAAILWLLHRAMKRNSTIAGAFAGLASVLALHTYPGSRLSILLGVVMLALFIASDRRLLRTRANVLATYLFVCIVGAMPIAAHYAIHPENFGARLAQENIFTSGILANDAATYGGYVAAIVRAALLSALPFFSTPAAGGFFHAPFPHLPALGTIALVIGHGDLLRRRRDPHTAAVLVWFWAAILLVSTLTSGPPTHERMLNTMPALAILVAVGIKSAVAPFRSAALRAVLAAALVIIISGRQVYAYFIEYDRSHAWEDPTNELTYETRHDIHSLRANGRVYLIGDPSVYRVFANFDFFSPNIEKA